MLPKKTDGKSSSSSSSSEYDEEKPIGDVTSPPKPKKRSVTPSSIIDEVDETLLPGTLEQSRKPSSQKSSSSESSTEETPEVQETILLKSSENLEQDR